MCSLLFLSHTTTYFSIFDTLSLFPLIREERSRNVAAFRNKKTNVSVLVPMFSRQDGNRGNREHTWGQKSAQILQAWGGVCWILLSSGGQYSARCSRSREGERRWQKWKGNLDLATHRSEREDQSNKERRGHEKLDRSSAGVDRQKNREEEKENHPALFNLQMKYSPFDVFWVNQRTWCHLKERIEVKISLLFFCWLLITFFKQDNQDLTDHCDLQKHRHHIQFHVEMTRLIFSPPNLVFLIQHRAEPDTVPDMSLKTMLYCRGQDFAGLRPRPECIKTKTRLQESPH